MADVKLNSLKFPNLPDRYILDADKVNYSDSETYADGSVGKALQTKANIDGSYESMTVGNAEQLVSNVRVNDKTPYLFRTSGGSVDIGDREYVGGIVGGTVAWNQLAGQTTFPNTHSEGGVTVAWQSDGSVKFSGTISDGNPHWEYIACVGYIPADNHKYLVTTTQAPTNTGGRFGILRGNGTFDYSGDNKSYYMFINDSRFNAINYRLTNGTYDFTAYFNLFDLTQLFGSTIADAIYAMEQATEGSGVAYFKSLFPNSYYAYNAGELMSVSGVSSHDMTGFNQWDEVWELGFLDNSTGQNVVGATTIRSKNYIPVIPSTSYYFKSPNGLFVYFYDANKNFVGVHGGGTRIVNNSISLGANVNYIRFSVPSEYGTTYKNDICINISWDGSRNGEYEPYELHSYPLDSDLTLRGIPKLDANNNLYYDGDTYEADGTVTRKYGVVDLGTLTWFPNGTRMQTYDLTTGYANTGWRYSGLCARYTMSNSIIPTEPTTDKVCGFYNDGFLIYDSAYSDKDTFKTAMSGVYLVYELATPTTETADPYQRVEIVSDFGTEEFVINDNTFAVPVGTDTEYPIDLRAKLEMAPNSPSDGDGDYIVRQTNGMNEYVPLVIEDALPTIPSATGSYVLTVTVADGVDPVLAWTQA